MILKHRDTEVLRFDWVEPFGVKNVEVNSAAERFLPLAFRDRIGAGDTKALTWAVEDWIMARKPPARRKYIDKMLSYLGLNTGNPRDLLAVSKGLSLNDVYWLVPDDSPLKWGMCNLYDNDFSSIVAEMAFTGSGRHQEATGVRSPEFTTDGALPKCWRRMKGKIVLYKGKSDKTIWDVGREDGFGVEPFSEYYAAQLAAAMKLDHVDYGLDLYKGEFCCTCPLFTSERYGFVAARDLPNRDQCFKDSRFADMFFFDAVIFNTDRHWGNFGYLVDNDTNEIVGPSPIFDNGYSLFSQARYYPGDPMNEFDDLRKFLARKSPVLYSDWLQFPGGVTDEMIDRLRLLKGFRFKHDKSFSLPPVRMEMIQYFLQDRISKIVNYGCKADRFIKIGSSDDTIKQDEERVTSPEDLRSMIAAALKLFPTISRQQLAERLDIGSATVARHIKALQEAGELKRVGSRKTGYWQVIEKGGEA